MALEDLLKEIIATTRENTATMKDLIAMRGATIEEVKAAAATGSKSTKTTTASAPPAETKPAEQPAPAAQTGTPGVDDATADEFSAMVAQYLGSATRDEEKAARKAKLGTLLHHDAIIIPGAPKTKPDGKPIYDTKNIMASAAGVFRDNLNALIAKGDLTQPAAPAASNLLDM